MRHRHFETYPHELDTGKSALGNDAGTVTLFGAPCDHLSFDVADFRSRLGRRPVRKLVQRRLAETATPGKKTHQRQKSSTALMMAV